MYNLLCITLEHTRTQDSASSCPGYKQLVAATPQSDDNKITIVHTKQDNDKNFPRALFGLENH